MESSIGVDIGADNDRTVYSVVGPILPSQVHYIQRYLTDDILIRAANTLGKPLTSLYLLMKEYPMFETAMFCDLLEQFCVNAHKNSKDKGFWNEGKQVVYPSSLGVKVAPGEFTVDEAGRVPREPIPETRLKERPINLGEKYMLLVSEIAELFEAHRKGILEKPCDKDATILDPTSTEACTYRCQMCAGKGTITIPNCIGDIDGSGQPHEQSCIKDCPSCAGTGLHRNIGVRRLTNEEEEIADIMIRIADYCGYRKIDLGTVILAKMVYNKDQHDHQL